MAARNQKRELVLASASPRRRELLGVLGVQFRVLPADIDESVSAGESPEEYVHRMALSKARVGLMESPESGVLGSDTVVVVDDRILGKPADRQDALAMLALLSGRSHRVLSAVALVDGEGVARRLSETKVSFRSISEDEAEAYWSSGEPADKAGAYAIQGKAAVFVREITGSYSGVVGLPLFETAQLLAEKGYGLALGGR